MSQSIYSLCLTESVHICLTHFSDMFSCDVIEYVSGVIRLEGDELNLISRMINRKHPWLRSDRLQHYVAKANDLDRSLDHLVSLGYIFELNENLGLEEIWESIFLVLSLDEWRRFYNLLKLSSTTTSATTITLMKNEIFRFLRSQKPLFGSIKKNLLSYIKNIIGKTRLLRLESKLITTIRRMQRLTQVTNSPEAASIHEPIHLNVPILVKFRKLSFPSYIISHSTPLFESRRHFEQFEATCELCCCLEMAKEADNHIEVTEVDSTHPGNVSIKNRLIKRLRDSVIPCFGALSIPASSSLVHKNSLNSLLANLKPTNCNQSNLNNVFCVDVDAAEIESLILPLEILMDRLFENVSSCGKGYVVVVTLIGVLCLVSYLKESHHTHSTHISRPDYFIDFDPGSNLVRVSCVALEEMEKLANLNYQLAISLLQCFLTLPRPYLAHRRGRWFNRLCIDIESVFRANIKNVNLTERNEEQSDTVTDGNESYTIVYDGQKEPFDIDETIVTDIELQKYSFLIALLASKDATVRLGETVLFQKRLQRLGKLYCIEPTSTELKMDYFPTASSLFEDIVYKVVDMCVRSNKESLNAKLPAVILLSNDLRRLSVNSVRKKSGTISSDFKSTPNRSQSLYRPHSEMAARNPCPWTCARCTFINSRIALQCEVCDNLKPISFNHVLSSASEGSPRKQNNRKRLIESSQQSNSDREVILIDDDDTSSDAQTDLVYSVSASSGRRRRSSSSSKEEIQFESKSSSVESSDDHYEDYGRTSEDYWHELFLLGIKPCSSVSGEFMLHVYDLEFSSIIEELNRMQPPAVLIFNTHHHYSGDRDKGSTDFHNYNPSTLSIRGRRFGYKSSSDPDFVANKGGKARYIANNDSVCSVEEYVANILNGAETGHSTSHAKSKIENVRSSSSSAPDEVDDFMYADMLQKTDGLGWRSLHCEGSPLKSLFALFLWDDVIFCDVPDVFISPYQSKPLDLNYSNFSRSVIRLRALAKKLKELWVYDNDEIIRVIGNSYRKHYKQICKGMNWNYSLDFLQLVAVCLGGVNLVCIFRALFVNFKFLSAGMPDLLSIRMRKISRSADGCANESCLSEVLDLSKLLRPGWETVAAEGDSSWDDLTNLTRKKQSPLNTTSTLALFSQAADDRSTLTEYVNGVDLESNKHEERTDIATIEDLKLPADSEGVKHVYESMLLEVKGPNDSLAPNQLLWSFILSQSKGNVKSYVGYVKEDTKRTSRKDA